MIFFSAKSYSHVIYRKISEWSNALTISKLKICVFIIKKPVNKIQCLSYIDIEILTCNKMFESSLNDWKVTHIFYCDSKIVNVLLY